MRRFAFGRFFMFLIFGIIVGTALGVFIGKVFPVFDTSLTFGIPNISFDLVFLKLSLGFELQFNVGTLIGIVIFILLFSLT